MTYALPYLALLVFFATLAVIYAQRCDREEDVKLCSGITFITMVVFFLFFALRGYVFTDWTAYLEYYEDATWSSIFQLTASKQHAVIHEPGFTLLMCLCKLISHEFPTLVIGITTIDCLLLWRFFKRWHIGNIPFFMMLFVMFQGVNIMFNLFRNQIAIFIFMNLLEYIEDKKPIKYFIGCAIATSFHTSSVLFFPLYFILGRKINKWVFLGAFLGFFIFYMSQISIVETALNLLGMPGILAEKAAVYTELFSQARDFSITGTIEKFGLVAMIIWYYDKLTDKSRNIILINCLLLYLFFYYMFAEFSMMSARLSMLFAFSYWLIWIEIMNLITIVNNKRLLGALLFVYCMYSQAVAYNEPIQQYDNFLFGVKSQEERIRIREKTFEDINHR